MGRISQSKRLIDYLHNHNGITQLEAANEFGIMRLSARIHDLEREGYTFLRVNEQARNRYGEKVYFTRYILMK